MSGLNQWKAKVAQLDFDLVERIVVVLALGLLAVRLMPSAMEPGNHTALILLLSETAVVLFVVFRRRTDQISRRPSDWIFGLAGTLLPLTVGPASEHPLLPAVICGVILIAGTCLHLAAKLTLRRSFGVVAANRGVKMGGPYRLVRHPMYAGYVLTHIGFLLSGPTFWNFAIYGSALLLQLARIRAEERILGQDPAYQTMSASVPYRLVPYVY